MQSARAAAPSFALWLHLEDVYWAKAGPRSIDAVFLAAGVAGLVVLGFGFWRDVWFAVIP